MKQIKLFVLTLFIFFADKANAQIEKVYVETYYISEEKDSADEHGGKLEPGSVTYRVFLDLEEGFALKALIGDTIRPFSISSSENFFNHQEYSSNYGYTIKPGVLRLGLMGLDSWLTLGYPTTFHSAVLKSDDPDTSIVGGVNSGGFLTNNASGAGIPLTTSDGLVQTNNNAAKYTFTDYIGDSTFSKNSQSNIFLFKGKRIMDDLGNLKEIKKTLLEGHKPLDSISEYDKSIIGYDTTKNHVLIAQLTTKGGLAFRINCELVDYFNNQSHYIYATDSLLNIDKKEYYSQWLSYPFKGGCTDPWFVQYDPEAVTDDGSCRDSIILGCMEMDACNYDTRVNKNVKEICCFGPDSCNNRNIAVVCPNYTAPVTVNFEVFPNPAVANLTLKIIDVPENSGASLCVYNSFGEKILMKSMETIDSYTTESIDLSVFDEGIYIIQIITNEGISSQKRFIKSK